MKKKLSIIVLALFALPLLACIFLPIGSGLLEIWALLYSIMVAVRFIHLIVKREISKALVIYVPTLLSVGVLVIRILEHIPRIFGGLYVSSIILPIILSAIYSLFARKSK